MFNRFLCNRISKQLIMEKRTGWKKRCFKLSLLLSLVLLVLYVYILVVGILPDMSGGSSLQNSAGSYAVCYSVTDVDYSRDSIDVFMEFLKPSDEGIFSIAGSSVIINKDSQYRLLNAYGVETDSVIDFSISDTIRCRLVFESDGLFVNHKSDTLVIPMPLSAGGNYVRRGIGSFYQAKKNLIIYTIVLLFILSFTIYQYVRIRRIGLYDNELFHYIINETKHSFAEKGLYSSIYKLLLDEEVDTTILYSEIVIHTENLCSYIKSKNRRKSLSEKDMLLISLFVLNVPNKIVQRLLDMSEKTLYNKKSKYKYILNATNI